MSRFAVILTLLLFAIGSSSAQQAESADKDGLSSPLPRYKLETSRFLGWNYSGDPEYIRQFKRPHADVAIPLIGRTQAVSLAPTLDSPHGRMERHPLVSPGLPGVRLPATLPAGYLPTSLATADFNRDGKIDWVVSNGGDNSLWLYFGRGDGTAELPTIIPLQAGLTPVWVTTGDLRGKGLTDIITANPDSSTIGLFLGNGDGTFAPEQEISVGNLPPNWVSTGDFNRDGKLDVLVFAGGTIVMFPGRGDGMFAAPVISTLTPFGQFLSGSAADTNGDGILDLVIVQLSGVAVAYGTGDGGFRLGPTLLFGIYDLAYLAVAFADLHGSGCLDVVATETLNHLVVVPSNCDGTFGTPLKFSLGESAGVLHVADLDGDGHPDIVAGGHDTYNAFGMYGTVAGNTITIVYGDGHGGFREIRNHRAGRGMEGVGVADLNGDGHLDIVAASQKEDSVFVLLNDGSGGFGPHGYPLGPDPTTGPGTANPIVSGLLFGDVDHDGRFDLSMLELPTTTTNYDLVTLLNRGGGNFSRQWRAPAFPSADFLNFDFKLAPFRPSGYPDFLVFGAPTWYGNPFLSFVPNLGGSFGTPSLTQLSGGPINMPAIAVGDFNRDGKLDFVAFGPGDALNSNGLTVYLGNGDGTFQPLALVPFGGNVSRWVTSAYAVDVNSDGKLDLLAQLYYNTVPYTSNDILQFIGNGDGTFRTPQVIFPNAPMMTVADLNHDGIPDLVLCKDPMADYPIYPTQPEISVYLGLLGGGYTPVGVYHPYTGLAIWPGWRGTTRGGGGYCTLGDFNGDGTLDLVISQYVLGGNSWAQFMSGNGNGTFTPTYDVFPLEMGTPPQYATDLNGDGIADWIKLETYSTSYQYLPGAPAPAFQLRMVALPVIGNVGQGQVTLNVPSARDTVIGLDASDPNIQLPANITVPAGAITQNFSMTFGPGFDYHKVAAIHAQLGYSQATTYAYEAPPAVVVPRGSVDVGARDRRPRAARTSPATRLKSRVKRAARR